MVMAVIFITIFFDLDPAKSFPLRQAGRAVTQQLGKLVEANVKAVNMTRLVHSQSFVHNRIMLTPIVLSWVSGIVDGLVQHHTPLTDYGIHMTRRLLDSGLGVSEVTWSQILPTAGAMVANQAQVVRQVENDTCPKFTLLTSHSLRNY